MYLDQNPIGEKLHKKLKTMKNLLVLLALAVPVLSFGQLLDGDLIDEGRKMISTSDFILYDVNEGVLYYELAVDRTGKVTSASLLSEGSTITATPTRMKARNYLVTLNFEAATHYPAFHHVRVRVTFKTPIEIKGN